jgi:ATP-binding protein involved in chromosome partitioning
MHRLVRRFASSNAKLGVYGVEHLVAVSSGKGGVGKSTTAVNLALAMSAEGKRVGLLDADIYGPSIPRLMNLSGRPSVSQQRFLLPLQNYGIKCMSMGFIMEEDAPTIWRGPMVMSAIEQMLRQVEWAPLDVLVVDLPPGTGDAQLTLCQRVKLTGAVIVSTPQDIALLDVRRGTNMFRKVDVPVLGVIENMSHFLCPSCGHESHIFGHGGAEKMAADMGLDFLGAVPLDMEVRVTSDEGKPVVVSNPESAVAQIYRQLARKILTKVSHPQGPSYDGPQISME